MAFRFEPLIDSRALFLILALLGYVILKKQKNSTGGLAKNKRRALYALKGVAFCLVSLVLLNPISVRYRWIDKPATVAVILDASQSMQIKDATEDNITRADASKEILLPLITKIRRIANAELYTIDDKLTPLTSLDEYVADASQTDFAPLYSALGEKSIYTAAIMISDGTATRSYKDAPLPETPIHTITVGRTNLHDTQITHLGVTRQSRKDTLVKLKLELQTTEDAPETSELELLDITNEKHPVLLTRRQVELRSSGSEEVVEFLPSDTGLRFYRVSLVPKSNELAWQNNSRVFAVMVIRKKIKVLYMEGSEYRRPMRTLWEHEYLEQALIEDGDIEVKTLLRKNEDAARAAGVSLVTSADDGYPKTRSELFEYDVVISSDIDIDFFSDEQIKNTVEFVATHGGGFVMVGGWTAFGAGGYDESAMDKMLPVDMMGRKNEHLEENENFALALTPEGLAHPIMQLVKDKQENKKIWESCPKFHGHNRVKRVKPAGVTLAEHDGSGRGGENLYGRDVIIAVQQYGNGRSMAFTTDTTAGWGTEFEESFGEQGDNRYYKKFWKNAIHWLSAFRKSAPSSRTEILVGSTYAANAPVEIKVRVLNQDYKPARSADVTLTVTSPDEQLATHTLTPLAPEKGLYRTAVTFAQKGIHQIKAEANIEGISAGEDVVALDTTISSAEFKNVSAHDAFLKNISHKTGGANFSAEEADKLFEQIVDLVSSAREETKLTLWDNPWLLSLILAALVSEWFLRKKWGLA